MNRCSLGSSVVGDLTLARVDRGRYIIIIKIIIKIVTDNCFEAQIAGVVETPDEAGPYTRRRNLQDHHTTPV